MIIFFFKRGWNGNDESCLYYLTSKKWDSIFGIKESTKSSMEEKLNYAKSLIGKLIKSRENGNQGKVEEVQVLLDFSKLTSPSFELKALLDIELSKHGYVIVLSGYWLNGNKMIYPITDFDVEIFTNSVKINGYDSVDKGDYFEFGCAKITKKQLRAALNFITETNSESKDSNRVIESVKIGAGEFTLKDIKTLLS